MLKAGAPTTLVPLDVTTQVRIEGEGMERIRAGGTEFIKASPNSCRHTPVLQSVATPIFTTR
ncbi:MAG: hypothetical protein WKH64_06980 [Chloroflexia bacterium]